MAIQLPDPGQGDGKTGDNEYVMWTKVKDNFSNTTHAASKLVGTTAGRIPLSEDTFESAFGHGNNIPSGVDREDLNTHKAGTRALYFEPNSKPTGAYYSNYYTLASNASNQDYLTQLVLPSSTLASMQTGIWFRATSNASAGDWKGWRSATWSDINYKTTTATAPNLVVESDGTLKRSSSSAKYKDVISKLELDNDLYQKAMQVSPIIYRSKADGDPNNWHFMSFLAEEVGELDPSLTQWKTHDYDSETGEQVELEQKEAEGINLNAICAVLHATNIYQAELIKSLEDRLTVLESK